MVIDAGIALKWVIDEDGAAAARELLLQEALTPPDLMAVECANVLWAKARRGTIARDSQRQRSRRSLPHRSLCDQAPAV